MKVHITTTKFADWVISIDFIYHVVLNSIKILIYHSWLLIIPSVHIHGWAVTIATGLIGRVIFKRIDIC